MTRLSAGRTFITTVVLLWLGGQPEAAFERPAPPAGPSTPVITEVVPANPKPGDTPQTLSIRGSEFLPGLVLEVTTPSGQTDTYSGDQIDRTSEARVDVSLLLPVEGRYSLVITNKDGGVSQPFDLMVQAEAAPEAPVITEVSPANLQAHPEPQTLNVVGRRFATGLRAILTDPIGGEVPDLEVRNVTPSSFELVVRLTQAGDYGLVVSNPSGAVSNVYHLTVQPGGK